VSGAFHLGLFGLLQVGRKGASEKWGWEMWKCKWEIEICASFTVFGCNVKV